MSNCEVILRDLESLLRKSHLGNDIKVLNYKTDNLLASGENFSSSILKVEANISKIENGKDETLHLVAKMLANSEFHRNNMNSSKAFVREIFIFEQLIPMYRKLQLQMGFEGKDLINILPKYYGGRLSLSGKIGEFDENAAYLMENLKLKNYCNMDKKNGMMKFYFYLILYKISMKKLIDPYL